MYLFNYIVFVIVMVMSCGIVSDITCIIYFLCKILLVCGIKCIISFTYVVCIISVNGITLIDSSIISNIFKVSFTLCFYLSYSYSTHQLNIG